VRSICTRFGLPLGRDVAEDFEQENKNLRAMVEDWRQELRTLEGAPPLHRQRASFRRVAKAFLMVGIDARLSTQGSTAVGAGHPVVRLWFHPTEGSKAGDSKPFRAATVDARLDVAIATDVLSWMHRGRLDDIHVCPHHGCSRVFTADRNDVRHCGRSNCRYHLRKQGAAT
jgi:hypothetical protein